MNYCSNCGNKLEPNQNFCPNCGKTLIKNKERTTSTRKPGNRRRITIIAISLALIVVIAAVVSTSLIMLNSDAIVNFPDANLNQAIRNAIGKPTGEIYQSNLNSLTTLSLRSSNINDLSGIEHCTNLQVLYLTGNNIINLLPLSSLTSLLELDLGSNNIHDISALAGLTNLQQLWLDNNPITDISALSNLTNLRSLILNFGGSPVTCISNITVLANLTNLEELCIGSINVNDISPLSGLINLRELSLPNNQISSLQALVSNVGLSSGDMIWVGNNPLSDTSLNVYIPTLEGRGVTVYK